MAKKKKTKAQPAPKLSPDKYIREKARSQAIDKCYITPSWKENGIAQIIITRKRASGNYISAIYLVDTFCLGVKDVVLNHDLTPLDLDRQLKTDIRENRSRRYFIQRSSQYYLWSNRVC